MGLAIEEKVVGKNGKEKIKAPPTVTFHTFRHTCVSLLLDDGRNIKQIQECSATLTPTSRRLPREGRTLVVP